MSAKKKKPKNKKDTKTRVIIGIIVVLLYTGVFSFSDIFDVLICVGLATVLGKFIGSIVSGLDLTTHNRQDEKEKKKKKEPEQPPVETLPLSGDQAADSVIAKGQQMLHQIRAENDAIPDHALSTQMDDLERLCVQIFKTVAEQPQKAGQIRKFMNYYLPTTLKMLASYRTMEQRGVSAGDLAEARATLLRGMGMVLTACQKQLDNLYKDTMLDVTTDIDVLEQMLKRDGFTQGELGSKAATATSAQMQQGAPVLDIPTAADEDDDFVSYYANRSQQK